MTSMSSSPLEVRRSAASVRRTDPGMYVLNLTLRGSQTFCQSGRTATGYTGDLMIVDSSVPFEGAIGGDLGGASGTASGSPVGGDGITESCNLHIPKSMVCLPEKSVSRLLGTRLSTREGVAAITAATLAALNAQLPSCSPRDAVHLSTIATDMFSALVAHCLDERQPLPPESRRAGRMLAVEAYIAEHLADPGLQPAAIAAAHHMSLRSLYQLFQERDTSVASWIRNQRLERARRDLTDPALRAMPVHRVAARWGFRDHSTFTRAFRAAYGLSPSAYRHEFGAAGQA
jgi:AraC-like DNA-binding protein